MSCRMVLADARLQFLIVEPDPGLDFVDGGKRGPWQIRKRFLIGGLRLSGGHHAGILHAAGGCDGMAGLAA